MRILLLADEEDKSIWDYYTPGKLDGIDMILSAGDLSPEYLSFLVTMVNKPLLYVHGNHDHIYDKIEPEGCECVDDTVITVNGLRILGLGGCKPCTGRPYHFSEAQMRRRIRKLRSKIRKSKGIDIILTHAPAMGYGDLEDLTHSGYECFLELIDKYAPKYLIHGHIHQNYGIVDFKRIRKRNSTTIINASGKYILDIPQYVES